MYTALTGVHSPSLSLYGRGMHNQTAWFSILSYFVHMRLCNSSNYLDRFTMASNVKPSFVIRVTNTEWVFSCPSSQSILFLCMPHIWGLSNFPRLPPQIRPRHTVFCIFMCVPSYLNPSYYSHGWPCQGEICSLTVNGPILTARPPHQRSV